MRKVAETATQLFITNDKCNVSGIVLAGSADFKNDLAGSDVFDPRLSAKLLKTVDVSYGGENGECRGWEHSPRQRSPLQASAPVKNPTRLQSGYRVVRGDSRERQVHSGEAGDLEIFRGDLSGHRQVLLWDQ